MDPFYFAHDDLDAAAGVFDEDYLMSSLGLILSPAPAALPSGSAFEAYQRRAPALLESLRSHGQQYSTGGGGANVHRRMFGYLRRIVRHDDAAEGSTGPVAVARTMQPAPADEAATSASSPQAPRSSRFRHIMRERLRRERLSQGFADLHALLPPGTSSKGGKNDIVGAAAGYIRELEGRKRWLRARNQELLERAASHWRGGMRNAGGDMVVKVRAESEDNVTAVDVFEAVLRRLKAMEQLRVTAIRSCFGAGAMWMNVGVQGRHQLSTHEVDKAITNALMELAGTGKELDKQDPRSSKSNFSYQVESGVPMG